MQLSLNAPAASPIAFGVVKQLLVKVGCGPETDHPRLAQSLRLYFPLDSALAARVRATSVSLTDAATASEQIRYFQRRRLQRNHITVARYLIAQYGDIHVEIGRCQQIDESSREFLDLASTVAGWTVSYLTVSFDSPSLPAYAGEASLCDALTGDLDVEAIVCAAWDYINVGDAWTGTALAKVLLRHEPSARVMNMLAIGNAMLSEPERAEFYYGQWASRGGPMDRVRALYGRSMLYARHHRDGFRDLGMAEACLQEAFDIIRTLSPAMRETDEAVFEEVFNRNGFALILFRRGDVDGALDLLRWGIDRLTKTTERVAIHRSVLIYNLAQCYNQIGDLRAAVDTYRRLLEVDPYMAEYRLEAAKSLSATGQHEDALEQCQIAVELDDNLAVSWRGLGLALTRCDRFDDAADAYLKAVMLEPENSIGRADTAYVLLRLDRPDDALRILEPVDVAALGLSDTDRHFSLLAEAHLRAGRMACAVKALNDGLRVHPGSATLVDNLRRVAAS
ncbi:tetratricopeptide repeat protein [Leifsonia sp. LS-T14]|uniref:tetratricopeptide repeat protein n=1 Tax=unclassified Leifsonia TaxID=2663824 RepID=UPI0035A621BA